MFRCQYKTNLHCGHKGYTVYHKLTSQGVCQHGLCLLRLLLASNVLKLHAFGDASEKGYGSVVYCRVPKSDSTYQVSLVISKGKVVPLKRITLPRLELLGSLLSARLVTFVLKALQLNIDDVSVTCWTDSNIALGWIKGDSCKWKPLVANRIKETQQLTKSCVLASLFR